MDRRLVRFEEGHRVATTHSLQRGLRARHTDRPCAIRVTCNDERKSPGIFSSSRRASLSFHCLSGAIRSRRMMRQTCVSTGQALRSSVYSITQRAVLRATPDRLVRYASTSSSGRLRSRVRSRHPSRASTSWRIARICRDFVRARPASLSRSSRSLIGEFITALQVGIVLLSTW